MKQVINFRKAVYQKKFHYSFVLKEKIKNFENSDSSTRKDHLEPNNTNSKTEIQKASNTDIGNEDKNKPSKQTNKQTKRKS